MDFHSRIQGLLYNLAFLFGCHQRPERSYFVRGRQIPLCARCCGLLWGVAVAPLWIKYVNTNLSLGCIALLILDGVSQFLKLRESTNWLRFGTGTGFSASLVALMWRSFRG